MSVWRTKRPVLARPLALKAFLRRSIEMNVKELTKRFVEAELLYLRCNFDVFNGNM